MLTNFDKNLSKDLESQITQLGLKSLNQESIRLFASMFSFLEMAAKVSLELILTLVWSITSL